MKEEEKESNFIGKKYITPDDLGDWRQELEVNDMAPCIYKEFMIFEKLLKHARNKNDIPATLIEVTRCLANLCTNPLLKSEILKLGGIGECKN